MAYQSNETGRYEVYVVPFPGTGVPIQVSTAGGLDPRWRDDGRAVFYRGPGNRLIAVNLMLQPNGRLEAGAATDLFTMPQEAVAYDITRDGQRVLVDMPVGPATTPPITIIQNWKHQP